MYNIALHLIFVKCWNLDIVSAQSCCRINWIYWIFPNFYSIMWINWKKRINPNFFAEFLNYKVPGVYKYLLCIILELNLIFVKWWNLDMVSAQSCCRINWIYWIFPNFYSIMWINWKKRRNPNFSAKFLIYKVPGYRYFLCIILALHLIFVKCWNLNMVSAHSCCRINWIYWIFPIFYSIMWINWKWRINPNFLA